MLVVEMVFLEQICEEVDHNVLNTVWKFLGLVSKKW